MKVKTLEVGTVGFPKHRLRNPIFPNHVYAYHQPLFGYYGVTVNTALSRQVAFAVAQSGQYTPAGGAQIALSPWHTNLIGQGGILPNPDRHFVKYLSLSIAGDTLSADAVRFLEDALLIFFMGSTAVEYWRAHGVKTPAGGGAFGFTSAFVGNGSPDVRNQTPFWGPPDPQFQIAGSEIIEQGQNFGVTVDPTQVSRANAAGIYTTATAANGGIGINAFIYLDGIRVRGTQ